MAFDPKFNLTEWAGIACILASVALSVYAVFFY